MEQQEVEKLIKKAKAARSAGDLAQGKRAFLQAAEGALLLAEKTGEKGEKKKYINLALSCKREAQNMPGEPSPTPSDPRELPEISESSSPPSSSQSDEPAEPTEISEEGAKKWAELGRSAGERGETQRAKRCYLKSAETYYTLAQKTNNSQYLTQGRHFKSLASDICLVLSSDMANCLQEARDEEKMAKLAEKDDDTKSAKIHYLKATERLLKLAESKEIPNRDDYLQQAMDLKKKADSLGKSSSPKDFSVGKEPSNSQPLRAEFLLKRAQEYEKNGLDARDEGNKKKATFYLTKSAELLKQLAEVSSEILKKSRLEKADRLLEIVESLGGSPKKKGGPIKQAEKDGQGEEKVFFPVEKPQLRFADIAGLEQVKEEVRRKMILPFQFPEQAEVFGVKKGGGILLYGPPGTGKTMIAQAIAAEIEAAFFTVRPSEIMSKWVGEAEKNINMLFETAREQKRSIIFIDEIESMVPSRRENTSNVMQRLVPQILAELEGFGTGAKNPLLFLGATNEPWNLDPAVLRPGRFDEKIYVDLPDSPAILKLLELNLGDKPLDEDVNLEELVDFLQAKNYSGADIKNICLKASTDAFVVSVERENSREITINRNQILRVIQKTRPSVTKEDLLKFEEYANSH